MGKAVKTPKAPAKRRAALTPEAKENQMISLAMDLAEEQMLNGTASSQIITHFLKLGSIKAQAELELLKMQSEVAAAKAESYKSAQHIEELYSKAVDAMRRYSGQEDDPVEFDEFD